MSGSRTPDAAADGVSRRRFLQSSTAAAGSACTLAAVPTLAEAQTPAATPVAPTPVEAGTRAVTLRVNGQARMLQIEPRVTLLDALREHLLLTGSKKGCDRGQCGACTVLVDGRRVNACLTLAVMHDGQEITTVEGLGTPDALHPMQKAFVARDAFQCGYCTPGQICSAVALVGEMKAGAVSAVSFADRPDARTPAKATWSDDEIRERMSGNLCRCGAYVNIVAAVRDVAAGSAA